MEWIKCSDRMPEAGQVVIGLDWCGDVAAYCFSISRLATTDKGKKPKFFRASGDARLHSQCNAVTHWQPLPLPPKD